MLDLGASGPVGAPEQPHPDSLRVPVTSLPAHFSSLVPLLISLKTAILEELSSNLTRLLALNRTRREALLEHLDRLSGQPLFPTQAPRPESPEALRRWIEGPLSRAQNAALHTYLEETALIYLGQTLTLKAWSDRGLRTWRETDLRDLNFALNNAIKAHLPLDREGWQITRQNIYSWFNPAPAIQAEIWSSLKHCRVTDEGPAVLITLLNLVRQSHPEINEQRGYDPRFFEAVWKQADFSQLASNGPIKRTPTVFSPTLRDGAMVRTAPLGLSWIGLESMPFQLLQAELSQLWWGPSAPPLWALGSGLEVHSRDQLSLALGTAKPSLQSRIADQEACDLAWVLEEKITRGNARNPDAQRMREQADSLPYFKKLRSAGTSLGDLQACVAISKLRPGGALWWARETPLSSEDGNEVLGFLLDRARILAEWDLSGIEHSLPASVPVFPRHLYLMIRETSVESRMNHRPARVMVQGHLRSHIELDLLLDDSLKAIRSPSAAARGRWQIHVHQSPIPQKEWAERWPDPACQNALGRIERLRLSSLPLASVTTVRPAPEGSAERNGLWSVDDSLKGLWIRADHGPEGRKLAVSALPRRATEARGHGYLVLVSAEHWLAPLRSYLESDVVREWLEHQAERRGERWVLTEQAAKWIPIPRSLLKALGNDAGAVAQPLPGEWERLAADLKFQPRGVFEALSRLNGDAKANPEVSSEIRAALFVRAAQALDAILAEHARLLAFVSPEGKLRWSAVLDILPKPELVSIPFHYLIQISGNLPAHLPIGQIERVKTPQPGILLATEAGHTLRLNSESPVVLDMLTAQLEGVSHPTWSELLRYLRLPRRVEIAETAASDLLRSHGNQSAILTDLREVLAACRWI